MKAQERIKQGRDARLKAEINHFKTGEPVLFSCIYLRLEQRNQFKLGWDSVSPIDIDLAIQQALGQLEQAHEIFTSTLNQLRETQ